LEKALLGPLTNYKPELVFYLAGADVFYDDELGGQNLTIPGILQRDLLVKNFCYNRNIPVVVVLAGGYSRKGEDTIQIHYNTALAFSGFA